MMNFVSKMMNFVFKMMAAPEGDIEIGWLPEMLQTLRLSRLNLQVRTNDKFCIINEEFCIKNEEFCIINEEFCIKNEEFCIKNEEFCIKNEKLSIIYDESCRWSRAQCENAARTSRYCELQHKYQFL